MPPPRRRTSTRVRQLADHPLRYFALSTPTPHLTSQIWPLTLQPNLSPSSRFLPLRRTTSGSFLSLSFPSRLLVLTLPFSCLSSSRISKFSSVTHLTLHFPTPTSSSYEEDTPIRVTYVSFCGDALKLRREVPTGVVYESNSRPVDHKVGGLGVGAFESKLGQ